MLNLIQNEHYLFKSLLVAYNSVQFYKFLNLPGVNTRAI